MSRDGKVMSVARTDGQTVSFLSLIVDSVWRECLGGLMFKI